MKRVLKNSFEENDVKTEDNSKQEYTLKQEYNSENKKCNENLKKVESICNFYKNALNFTFKSSSAAKYILIAFVFHTIQFIWPAFYYNAVMFYITLFIMPFLQEDNGLLQLTSLNPKPIFKKISDYINDQNGDENLKKVFNDFMDYINDMFSEYTWEE